MSFFKKEETEKKKIELPNIQGMPELPPLPNSNQEKNDADLLPPLPKANSETSFRVQTIKNNIDSESYHETVYNPESNERKTFELGEIPKSNSYQDTKDYSSKSPVFIKIDKFKDAVEKFEDIKDKEDQELKLWEQEIQEVKNKVANIDNSLFSKI